MTKWLLLKAILWRSFGSIMQAVKLPCIAGRVWAKANAALDRAYEAARAGR